MDGVLSNWEKQFEEIIGMDYSKYNKMPKSPEKLEIKTKIAEHKFYYAKMDAMPKLKTYIKWMQEHKDDYEFVVLSSAGVFNHHHIVGQKTVWLGKNIPSGLFVKHNFVKHSEDKAEFAKADSILIDDRSKAFKPFKARGGHIVDASKNNVLKDLKKILDK
jgi:hypothetical protein